jgi:23S rRNA pseudouridine2605 synthase
MQERLQKIMSRAGVASRRQAEGLILGGKVRVNGQVVTELGTKADPAQDEIRVSGRLIAADQPRTYLLLHKPVGYVATTSDPEGRPTVLDLIHGVKERLYPVGRLDWDTSGLLLLTNDGELTHLLTHPSSEVPRTYEAKVEGIPNQVVLNNLARGVLLDGRPTRPAKVRRLRSGPTWAWLQITLTEGRNRQVRRMCEAVGHPVLKLHRVALGPLQLGDLQPGRFRPLHDREIKQLLGLTVSAKKTGATRSRAKKRISRG